MLVLSRKRGERLCLCLPSGDTVWLSVEMIGSHAVKLGVDAPNNVEVLREEIMEEPDVAPMRDSG